MIFYSTKKSILYSELDAKDNKKYFDCSQKKVLHNIDSLYYTVKVKNDWNHDDGCRRFVELLSIYKAKAIKSFDPYVLFQGSQHYSELGTEFVMNGIGQGSYLYDISKVDKYLMFVIGHQLNDKTPEIIVQIRSQNLWTVGEYEAVQESLKDIEKILSMFEIEIEEVQENRIDFAYHTNYIQDPTNYFQVKNLNKIQESNFKRWSLEGMFKSDFDVEVDYFTLGRKKSNNLFFRVYDKTKEVIEQGYKQFFLKLWYLENMINYFDLWCLEKAFLHPTNKKYDYLDIARLEFYLEFGSNEEYKNRIRNLIYENKNIDYPAVIKLADTLVPKITKVLNVEIETKRKFYYSMDNAVNSLLKLHTKNVPEYAKKLFVKLDNKQVFHDYLVSNNDRNEGVIRFLDHRAKNQYGESWTKKKHYPTSDFWKRIQRVKVQPKYNVEKVKLLREYQKSLSAEMIKKKITNNISTYSLYVHGEDVNNDTYHDVLDYMSTLNESDIEKAIEYKRKKFTLIQNRLGDIEGLSKLDKKFKIYDTETGESFTSYD